MIDLRKAAEQALETLDLVTGLTNYDDAIYRTIDALRAALAEPTGGTPSPVDLEPPVPVGLPAGEQTGPVAGGSSLCGDARLDDAELADLRQSCREGWRYASELEDERKRLQAELDRMRGTIPAGWALVPVEPTQEMLDAGTVWLKDSSRLLWAAMLAAAPKFKGELK